MSLSEVSSIIRGVSKALVSLIQDLKVSISLITGFAFLEFVRMSLKGLIFKSIMNHFWLIIY